MLRNTAEVETVYLGASQATSPAPGRVTEASPVSSTVGCKEVQTESGPDKSQGLLDLVQPGTLLVDSSTIDPNASKSLNAAAAARVRNQSTIERGCLKSVPESRQEGTGSHSGVVLR